MGRPEKQGVALSKKPGYQGAVGVGEKEGTGDRRTATAGARGRGERLCRGGAG